MASYLIKELSTQAVEEEVPRSSVDSSSSQECQPTPPPETALEEVCYTEEYTVEVNTTEIIAAPDYISGGSPDSLIIGTTDSGNQFQVRNYSGEGSYTRTTTKTETRTRRVCETREVTENTGGDQDCTPTPAPTETVTRWIADRNLGWNSGARSVERLNGDVYLSFEPRPANNTAVGLARHRTRNHFRVIPYAFLFNAGQFRIFESGEEVRSAAFYSSKDTFQILRVGQEVVYKHNEQVVHRSATPSTGSLITVAAMYTAGDKVY